MAFELIEFPFGIIRRVVTIYIFGTIHTCTLNFYECVITLGREHNESRHFNERSKSNAQCDSYQK